ncbi:SUKH-4 family immunity protein [Streptomyces sp. NPDC051569]|uniref:SUKH-4 family immunity protein n=1 Tax=Streptomyces sp. NPDC051569 TaxID=3365661 RepID=UPI0037B3589E
MSDSDPKSGRLFLDGESMSGKSRLLEELPEQAANAVLVDAAGLSAEELTDRVMRAVGVSYGSFRDLFDLESDMEELEEQRVVLLANTQWSGATRTTVEPRRIMNPVVSTFASYFRRTGVRFVVEVDSSVESLHEGAEAVLLESEGAAVALPDGTREPRRLSALRALALAEPRRVRFEEWAALCAVLGHDIDEAELRILASDLTLLCVDEEPEFPVRFARESVARRIRRQMPAETFRACQQTIVRRLFGSGFGSGLDGGLDGGFDGGGGDPLAAYAVRALPAHAAAAGLFEEFLADPRHLVRCEYTAVLEGLGAAFPDGIPGGSLAARLHYLHRLGPAPASQEEWVSLLHHNALCWDDTERAEAFASAAGPLPWTTPWTNWRPGGSGRIPATRTWTGAIEYLRADPASGRVISTNEDGTELPWDAATGELVEGQGPEEGRTPEPHTSVPPPLWRPDVNSREVRLELVADPSVTWTLPLAGATDAVAVGELVVLGGTGSVHAVRMDPEWAATHTAPKALPQVDPYGRVTPRPCDEEVRHASRARLTAVFGSENVPVLSDDRLPAGLTHRSTRDFLTHTGFPAVSGFYSLDTVNLGVTGLREEPWQGTRSYETPQGDGPFYRLGTWIGGDLYLDGTTGQILRQATGDSPDAAWPGDPFVGATAAQFAAMVALQWEYMLAYTQSGGADSADVLTELGAWLSAIDPAAASSRSWQHVQEADNFPYL